MNCTAQSLKEHIESNFKVGESYWFQYDDPVNEVRSQAHGAYYAGRVIKITPATVQWVWYDEPDKDCPPTRYLDWLQRQNSEILTAEELELVLRLPGNDRNEAR